jgi:hypothetical protein
MFNQSLRHAKDEENRNERQSRTRGKGPVKVEQVHQEPGNEWPDDGANIAHHLEGGHDNAALLATHHVADHRRRCRPQECGAKPLHGH